MAKTARRVPKCHRPTSPSFPALVKRYQDELETGLRAADPMERNRCLQKTLSPYALAHLGRFFARIPLESIDTALTTGYAMRRLEAGEDRDIVDGELRALSRLLTFAVDLGWLGRHPTIHFVPRPRSQPTAAAPPLHSGMGLRPRRWFREVSESAAPKRKKWRRNYLLKSQPDGRVPLDVLRALADKFKSEKAPKLTARLNDIFPGLKADRTVVDQHLKTIRALPPR